MVKVVQGRLINALAKQRKEKESKSRPILFVAHCLGGVILEGAIMDVHNDEENGQEIVSCIRGILLLGTPHFKKGLEPAAKQYFKYAAGSEDAELPEQFPDIISTTEKFLDFQRKNKDIMKLKSFCASKGTPINQNLAQLSQGSKPQLLDRDHLQLSQFVDSGNDDSGNDDFEEVLQTLTDWLENIDQASEEHSGPERDEPSVNFSGSKNSGMQFGTNKSGIHGLTFITN
ncbi:hypothetical protein ACHAPE_005542 [Trichoderma viride]